MVRVLFDDVPGIEITCGRCGHVHFDGADECVVVLCCAGAVYTCDCDEFVPIRATTSRGTASRDLTTATKSLRDV